MIEIDMVFVGIFDVLLSFLIKFYKLKYVNIYFYLVSLVNK